VGLSFLNLTISIQVKPPMSIIMIETINQNIHPKLFEQLFDSAGLFSDEPHVLRSAHALVWVLVSLGQRSGAQFVQFQFGVHVASQSCVVAGFPASELQELISMHVLARVFPIQSDQSVQFQSVLHVMSPQSIFSVMSLLQLFMSVQVLDFLLFVQFVQFVHCQLELHPVVEQFDNSRGFVEESPHAFKSIHALACVPFVQLLHIVQFQSGKQPGSGNS